MSRLAVIGTFYAKHENSFPLLRRLLESTRQPDECWLMCETEEDEEVLVNAYDELHDLEVVEGWPSWITVMQLATPKLGNEYAVIPYSNKINWALDATECDLIVYLDNGSMPAPEKYKVMADALEAEPDWGGVYCTQRRTGFSNTTHVAEHTIEDAFCVLNYTQVMHRKTDDRWPLDMELASPDLADATFWRLLHQSLGPFHPVGGSFVLDDHHIPEPHAYGL